MKYLLIPFLLFSTAQAVEIPLYQTSLYTGVAALFLILVTTVFVLMRKCAQEKKRLAEKEEKIVWQRQINAQNEHRHIQREQEMEKEILRLNHTIETLEIELKEGTKNQVVNKIEALQRKRQTAQSRINSMQ